MATLTFEKIGDAWEAEATLDGGRFALHLEFRVTEETRTRQVEVEVDVLDPETNEPTGEKTTETQTQTYTVTVDNVSDNVITIGRSVTGENYSEDFTMPFSGEVYDATFDGLVSGMGILIRTKNEPASGAILS